MPVATPPHWALVVQSAMPASSALAQQQDAGLAICSSGAGGLSLSLSMPVAQLFHTLVEAYPAGSPGLA